VAVEARARAAQGKSYLRALKADAVELLRLLKLGESELSLLLCDEQEIRRLNRTYRNNDKPTDVLSFAQEQAEKEGGPGGGDAPPAYPHLLGDVVISLETAAQQARALGQSPRERLRTLLIHGVLHLIGYDHERSAAEARRMFARERKLAAALVRHEASTPATVVLPRTGGSQPQRRLARVNGADPASAETVAGIAAGHQRGRRPSQARVSR